MSADYNGIGFRLFTDSSVLHTRPDSTVEIFAAGTSTPVIWSGTTDAVGVFSVPTLATGHYDLRVDGVFVSSFHHVLSDHTHLPNQSFSFFIGGDITADQDDHNEVPYFAPGVAGTIEEIQITARTNAIGDLTVHLLRGLVDGATALTVASDSIWQKQINPGATNARWAYQDTNPGLAVIATHAFTIGIDWTANTVAGLCLTIIFRPTV